MNLKFLPLGSTCVTNNADLKLVVIGYKINGYDYVAVEYPVGYENESSFKYFNHDQIIELYSYGYKDEMGKVYFVSLDDGTPNAIEPEEENIDLAPVMAFEELTKEEESVAFISEDVVNVESTPIDDSLNFDIEMPKISLDDTPVTFNDEPTTDVVDTTSEESPFVFADNLFEEEPVSESENLFVSDTVSELNETEEVFDESLFAPVAPFIEEDTVVAEQPEIHNPEIVSPEVAPVAPVEILNPEIESAPVTPEVAPVDDTIIFGGEVPTLEENINMDIPTPEVAVVESDTNAMNTFVAEEPVATPTEEEPKKEEKKKRGFFNFGR